MNIEAWQAQQKAEKEEDRKRKTQAAEALRNYRSEGLSEDDTKLSVLREQDRQQKIDAERKLRGYRSSFSEEEKSKVAALKEQERKQEMMNEDSHSPDGFIVVDDFTFGAVSSIKETFDTKTPSQSPSAARMRDQFYVTFIFGLISDEAIPSLDYYLSEFNGLASQIMENDDSIISFQSPSIKGVEQDGAYMDPSGRSGIYRNLVTVSVPFSCDAPGYGENAKGKMIDLVRQSIQSGSLQRKR